MTTDNTPATLADECNCANGRAEHMPSCASLRTTLATAKHGGCVQLGDSITPAMVDAACNVLYAYWPSSRKDYRDNCRADARAAMEAALAASQPVRIYGCCAQPEGDLHTAECPNMRHLAAHQPVGESQTHWGWLVDGVPFKGNSTCDKDAVPLYAGQPGPTAQAVDPTDPWRGLYSPDLMPKLDGVNMYHVAHPDLPSWPKDEDEECGIGPLITAQGFAVEVVFGEYPDDDGEAVDYCAWLASWSPESPKGADWRLVCIQDTEDGPAAFFVRPLALIDSQAAGQSFQAGVAEWMGQCFLASLYSNMTERGDRLLEEVLELLQAHGYDKARIPTLVDYVFGRPVGEPAQEVGGVMVTLAGYCWVAGLDMHAAGDAELARINQPDVMAKIRAKQEAKNALHFDTPLPGNAATSPPAQAVDLGQQQDAARWRAIAPHLSVEWDEDEMLKRWTWIDFKGDALSVPTRTRESYASVDEAMDAVIDSQAVGNG